MILTDAYFPLPDVIKVRNFDLRLLRYSKACILPLSPLRRAMFELSQSESDLSEAIRSAWIGRARILLDSYEQVLGRSLIERTGRDLEDARLLYAAPFAVLSHGTQADPILDYGNRVALTLWETTPDVLTTIPSRLTAEPVLQEAREKFLAEVAGIGFVTGYSGVRISSTGRRFLIKNVTVWNLADAQGRPAGQAAAFDTWQDLASNSPVV